MGHCPLLMLPVVRSIAMVFAMWLAPMVSRAMRRRDNVGGSLKLHAR
jgi:hypothetical protein